MHHSLPRIVLFRVLIAALCILSAAPPDSVAIAAEPRGERIRVGVVLGGGGARGAAHIGVLRELERMRVPIDAIAGTSMGAIIGGLYASGRTVDELEDIVRNIDWSDAFNDDERRVNKRFRRKQDDRDYPIGFELGVQSDGLRLPKGAISGQKVALILRELTLNVPSDSDFDDLPIPFRAVASDLASGEQVEMGEGDLATAIRASMAAPGIIAPVEIAGRSLVDGGLGGNVPVDTIRSMGVDVIIAVDVEFPLYRPDQLNSVLDISAQMLTILIRNQTREKLSTLADSDFLIRPELGQFGTTDFANIELAIEPGSRAAAALEDRLRRLALDEGAYAAHIGERQSRLKATPDRIEFVELDSDSGLAARMLKAHIKTEPGDPVDTNQLAADASALHGLYAFERVGYELVERDGVTGIRFDAVSKSWGPNYLLFGLSLQDDFEGATAFNVAARLTRTEINALGAEWRNDLQLGNRPFYRTELYQPTGLGSRFFVAPRLEIGQTNFNVFDTGARLARYRVTRGEIALDIGRELGRWGEFRAGVFRGYSDARRKVGDPLLGGIEADTGGTFLQLAFDTLDDGQIPRNGELGTVRLINSSNRLGADNDAGAIESSLSLVRSFGRHSIELGALLNVATEDSDLVQNFYPLGGFLRLSGLARGEISGPHAGVARIVYYRRTGNTGGDLFEIPLYFGASLEAGNVWERRSDIGFDDAITSGSLFLGLDTYFGPLYLAAGLAEGGRTNFYLSLGTPP